MAGFFSRLFHRDRAAAEKRLEHEVRIAVYDSLATVPRIVDVRSRDCADLLNELASRTYAFAHEKGGRLPFVAIKEIVENLLHADFAEAVISVLPDGNTIRVSDQGPGIIEKDRAFLPGFTTATAEMKRIIRGVGSGLPIVKDSMQAIGGSVSVDENLRRGCVVTLTCAPQGARGAAPGAERHSPRAAPSAAGGPERAAGAPATAGAPAEDRSAADESEAADRRGEAVSFEKLDEVVSARQRKVFMTVAEKGEAGPSTIVRGLDISLSTAYRDLVTLEELGLLETCDSTGKRRLTQRGMAYLARLAR